MDDRRWNRINMVANHIGDTITDLRLLNDPRLKELDDTMHKARELMDHYLDQLAVARDYAENLDRLKAELKSEYMPNGCENFEPKTQEKDI